MEVDQESGATESPPDEQREPGGEPARSAAAAEVEPGLRALDPRALTVALWSGAITYVLLIGPLTLGVGIAALLLRSRPLAVAVIVGLWAITTAGLAYLCFYWPRLAHRRVAYVVDDRGLQILRGVLWRSHIFVARSRIQHTDVAQGPLQRRMGLARLVVHTAGTHNASTTLSGVAENEAVRIRDRLTAEGPGTGPGLPSGGLDDGV